jgi:hypothetical protein
MNAHDLDLKPSLTIYKRWTKGSRPILRFSRSGARNIEDDYARHFVSPRRTCLGARVKEVLVDTMGIPHDGGRQGKADTRIKLLHQEVVVIGVFTPIPTPKL